MKMTTFRSSARAITTSLIAVTAFAACQPRANTAGTADATDMRARSDSQVAVTPPPAAPVTGVMPLNPMMMQTDTGKRDMPHGAMMDSLHTHMMAMARMSGEEMQPMLPMHREMANGALAHMTSARQSMQVATDGKWNAVADSVRQDLTDMPAMTATNLKSMMPAHHDRMMRLMQSYRGVVGGAK